MKSKITLLLVITIVSFQSFSQEKKSCDLNVSLGADLVSSYLWRGFSLGNAPAIQPWGDLSFKGFSLGAWGSYEVTGDFKEIDIYAKYTFKSVSLQFVDLFFPGYPGLDQNYFNYKNASTGHASELALSFNGTSKIPVSVYAGMIMYGAASDPKTDGSGELNRSVYVEVNYLGNFKDISYNVFAGFTPTSSVLYATDKFSFINVGVSAKKAIKVTDNFSIPIKLTLAANPITDKLNMAVAVSL